MGNLTTFYKGTIYPINPKGGKIFNIEAYKSLDDLPETPALAVVALNAEMAIYGLEDAGKHKIPHAIIFAGGYSEIGSEGKALEEKIDEVCKETGIRLIGPNCMGTWDKEGLNASFMSILPKYPGSVSFLSQSGSLIAFAIYLKLRLGKFVSLGNSIDVSFHDLMPYLAEDKDTRVVALYIEQLNASRKFLASIKDFPKPIVAVKSGDTEAGQRSIASHTGALAGNAKIYDTMLKSHGVMRVKSFEDMAALTRAFDTMDVLPKNNKIVALSNAGGAVCLFSDACNEFGVDPAPLPEALEKKLRDIFPPQAPVNNPLDLTVTGGTPENIKKVLRLLMDTSLHDYGTIVYIPVVPPYMDPKDDANIAIEMARESHIPFMTCLLAGDKVAPAIPVLDEAGIPYCENIRQTAEVISHLVQYAQKKK